MLNKCSFVLFLAFICQYALMGWLESNEHNVSSENVKKYNLSICAIFKNEALFLKDWIEYHRSFGVDHFYLYDIGSSDFYRQVLGPYIKEGLVTLVNWPEVVSFQNDVTDYQWALSTQIPAYENAVNFLARNETKWLVFVDINEFLVSSEGNILTLLNKYDNSPGICFPLEFFDGVKYDLYPSKTSSKSTENTSHLKNFKNIAAKMIFKPELCIGSKWPPYECCFKEPQASIEVESRELRVDRHLRTKAKHNVEQIILSDIEVSELFNKDQDCNSLIEILEDKYMIEVKDRPIYQQIPEFIKNLE